MQRRRMGFLFLAALSAVFLLTGCGSSSTQPVPPATGAVLSVATPTVGMKNCTTCHTAQTASWMKSRHANAENGLSSAGSPPMGAMADPECAKCHDRLGDSAQLVAGYTGDGIKKRPVVGCEDCHGGGANHNGTGPIGFTSMNAKVLGSGTNSLFVSAQFQTCSRCHQLLDQVNPLSVASTTVAHMTTAVTPTGNQYIITDTHFASPGIYGADGLNTSAISGYVMGVKDGLGYGSPTVCTDCHNPHGSADVNREWYVSKHGFSANKADDPWAYYNWSCDGTSATGCGTLYPFGPANDWKSCQRCHTTTGFASYVDMLGKEDFVAAEKIRTGTGSSAPIAYTPNFKPEMLLCTGCHSDGEGTIRNPGAYKAQYDIVLQNKTKALAEKEYPDVAASNVCMPCHTGRMGGQAIHALNTTATVTVSMSNFGFAEVSPHFKPSGGTVFQGTGYEYSDRNYTAPASFRHVAIGSPSVPSTGQDGPCVGCHMYRTTGEPNHIFMPVNKTRLVSGGPRIVTTVTSEVCFFCHPGSSAMLADVAQKEKDKFNASLQALSYVLNSAATYSYVDEYPYFATTNWTAVVNSSGQKYDPTGKNNIGAAFNYALLLKDQGAYVHNSYYTKRLIYDSIDWIDDGSLNFSVGDTLDKLCPTSNLSAQVFCPDAKIYLLPYGTRKDVELERP